MSNQLKFNLNTIVDNLNLINIVHKPEPIVIQNLRTQQTRYDNRNALDKSSTSQSNNYFEVIDEGKLSMYSYLIQRDLKTKEWLSKFELNNYNSTDPAAAAAAAAAKVSSNISKLAGNVDKNLPKQTSIEKVTHNKSVAFSTTVTNKKPKQVLKAAKVGQNEIADALYPTKLTNDYVELRKCCEDTVNTIEHLNSQLNEFKNERLKLVFNDPIEERKQSKQQMEQIKHLSRSVYNFQNQLTQLRQQGLTVVRKEHQKHALTPIARLIHTMRQVNRLTCSFAELYPYRPDSNAIAERLCFHFYKQLHLSVDSFNQCINSVSDSMPAEFSKHTASSVSDRLYVLLSDCDRYFGEFVQAPDGENCTALVKFQSNKPNLSSNIDKKTKKSELSNTNIVNVVRLPRSLKKNKNSAKSLVSTKTVFEKEPRYAIDNTRIELSPTRKSEKLSFAKKTVKTDRLFPGKSKGKHFATASVQNKSQIATKNFTLIKSNSTQNLSQIHPECENNFPFSVKNELSPSRLAYSLEDLNSEYNKRAFEHLSSPKLNRYVIEKRRSRSSESNRHSRSPPASFRNSETKTNKYEQDLSKSLLELRLKYEQDLKALQTRHDYRARSEKANSRESDMDQSMIRKFYNNHRVSKPESERSVLRNSSSYEKNSPTRLPSRSVQKLLDRLDSIKFENDIIRRKYEKLDYKRDYTHRANEDKSGLRRPYEECYLENGAVETEEYESKIDFNKVYQKLRPPTNKQLDRVTDYADKFYDYYQKTSVTTIGESKFDDFELFELLSEDFFEECLLSVYDELEEFNEELASDLINNEFDVSQSLPQANNQMINLNESLARSRLISSRSRASSRSSQRNDSLNKSRRSSTYSSFDSNNDSLTTISN